eukprot:gene5512-6197_t
METSLNLVLNQIKDATERFAKDNALKVVKLPRLVAVSKTKPVEKIEAAYVCGQRHFGENYVQELVQKSKYFKERGSFDEIRWHFIGHLQKNKINNLCNVSNLDTVETVDSSKTATLLNHSWGRLEKTEQLRIFVQVNTSLEQSKKGCCDVETCCEIVDHIKSNCPNLKFVGLMTIGSPGHDYSKGPNPDFEYLISCRREICERFQFNSDDVELSMGMSADFIEAILSGSTNVRVGSTIFGQRDSALTTHKQSTSLSTSRA